MRHGTRGGLTRRRLVVLAVVALLAGAFVLAAFGASEAEKGVWDKKYGWMVWGKDYWPSKPVRGGYYRTAATRYVGLMNPNHWPVNDWGAISLFYEGITGSDGENKQKNPWLLHSWTYPDPLTLDMKLKKGVVFHDGSVMDAAALQYQVEWMGDRNNGAWTRADLKKFKEVKAIDPYTVRWKCKEPWGSFPTGFFGFVISAEALKKDVALRESGNAAREAKKAREKATADMQEAKKMQAEGKAEAKQALEKAEQAAKEAAALEEQSRKLEAQTQGHRSTDVHPVGTGPYMIEDASPDNFLKMKRNPNWWFGKSVGQPDMPYFDGMLITVIPDPSIQVANLRAGKIDSVALSKSQYSILKNDPNFAVFIYPHNTVRGLGFNQSRGPCQDLRVRRAISHAINRKALIAGTQFGLAREAACFIPPNHWAADTSLKPVAYNPELSKKLLAEAGFKDGLTITGFMSSDPDTQTRSEAIKNMLAEAGIRWNVDAVSPIVSSDRMTNLEYDLAQLDFGYVQDPDSFLIWFYVPGGNFNKGRNKNEQIQPMIEAGRQELDDAKRAVIYRKIQQLLYQNYEDVWLYQEMVVVAYRKKVQGFNQKMYEKGGNLYSYSHPLWFSGGKP